jgi:glycosyltransferase involved in cell wall biosynthesis
MILYTYFGYPLMLYIIKLLMRKPIVRGPYQPAVDIIIPAYNEEKVIAAKINNTFSLDYPAEKTNVIVVSDASSDGTDDIIQEHVVKGLKYVRLEKRLGKAEALNRGLKYANGDVVVFTDASILLARSAIKKILQPLEDLHIGCVSGEDHIPGGGGEGLYGKYELLVRNLESHSGSIVGASGCFYAQRRNLCPVFTEGRAPDFLSVLETVRKGSRAITEASAIGMMGRVQGTGDEFKRKTRTIIRGITTLMDYKNLMNPLRFGMFSVSLLSHKIMRWCVGWAMVVAFLSNIFILDHMVYTTLFVLQICFYSLAVIGWRKERSRLHSQRSIFRIPLFFCLSNFAAAIATIKYLAGVRQELWESSKR